METARPLIVGTTPPKKPFPLRFHGEVQKGFGRGSKELGIPTANLPEGVAQSLSSDLETGIYFGYSQVDNLDIQPMVPSLTNILRLCHMDGILSITM
jgi:riboflavin kinase